VNKAEKIGLWLWVAAGIWTITAFAVTDLTSLLLFLLMISVIGLPVALLLPLLPSAFLYLSASAPLYLLLRRKSRRIAAAFSIGTTLAIMTAIPVIVNNKLAKQLVPMTSKDGGAAINVPSDSVVAVLSAYSPSSSDTECEEYCQRLLFSGVARAVIRGHVSALDKKSSKLQRYWLGPAKGPCRPAPMTKAYAMPQDIGHNYPGRLLQERARDAYADGKCFFAQTARLAEADVVLAGDHFALEMLERQRPDQPDLRLMQLDSHQWIGTWTRHKGGFRPAMRQSYASARKLEVPLLFDAPFTFDVYSPAQWRTDGLIEVGQKPPYGLAVFITNDTRVRGFKDAQGNLITPN
jgi:hypothetical protein